MNEYDKHHHQNDMVVWAELYAYAMSMLTDGQMDISDTLDDAYVLFEEHGHREASEVAAEIFKTFK